MPTLNIALNLFSLAIVTIVFISCLVERVKGEVTTNSFVLLTASIIVSLIGDLFGWIGEGHPELVLMTVIGHTVSTCAAYLSMIFFIKFLKNSLFGSSKGASVVAILYSSLCILVIVIHIFNAYFGFAHYVDEAGHYVHSNEYIVFILHLQVPILAFIASSLMSLLASRVSFRARIIYILYAIFPMAGAIIDFFVHGFSLTNVGLVISTMLIYTNIYHETRKQLAEQKTAIMISQINPHFMYNSLTTMASLCDTSPKEAKNLIIDFSRYLRKNIDSITSKNLVPFDEELSHIECYLKIEKARFGDKLNILYSIDCKNFELPPLSIQPIVENAVKHGITKKVEGGTLKISTYATDKSYVIEVKDDGVGFDTNEPNSDYSREHVGLINVRERLKLHCRGTLTVKSMKDVGTRVTIDIPKKQKGII